MASTYIYNQNIINNVVLLFVYYLYGISTPVHGSYEHLYYSWPI